MEEIYKEVYVKDESDLIEIEPEYVYLTIPKDYVCTYHKLLVLLADFGITNINACNNTCCKTKNIINCWNLFQSALACYTLGRIEDSKYIINYVNNQLSTIFISEDYEFDETVGNSLPITPDGKVKAMVSCSNEPKFYVDNETGELFTEYQNNKDNNKVYCIENDNLITEK